MPVFTRYMFIAVLFLFFSYALKAQSSSVLPSLISQEAKDKHNDSDIEAMLRKKMFVKIFTNKNKIFIGEPLLATYKFYVVMNISDQPTVTKQPEFSGCSVKELNFDQGPELETINNELYAVYTIRKVQLMPLQQGTLSLGKASVNNFVELTNPDDPFVTKKYNIVVSNADNSVEVNELPPKDKPENFAGIAGVFTISAKVLSNKIPVGENDHLIVTIKGSGNLDAINKPEVLWSSETDHFEGSDSQHIDQNNFPVSGDRIFDIPFIGKKEGTIIIPPVQFSFFNTSVNNYQTIKTDSISVTFTKAVAKKNVFTDVVNYDITNRKYLWLVPAIAITVALFGFISYRRGKLRTQPVKPVVSVTDVPVFVQSQPEFHVRFRTDFSNHLTELKSITESKPFFTRSKELLSTAVAERLDTVQQSENVLLNDLKERTYNAPVCNKVEALYEAINLNIYAPYETLADLDFYFNELKLVIEELQAEG